MVSLEEHQLDRVNLGSWFLQASPKQLSCYRKLRTSLRNSENRNRNHKSEKREKKNPVIDTILIRTNFGSQLNTRQRPAEHENHSDSRDKKGTHLQMEGGFSTRCEVLTALNPRSRVICLGENTRKQSQSPGQFKQVAQYNPK